MVYSQWYNSQWEAKGLKTQGPLVYILSPKAREPRVRIQHIQRQKKSGLAPDKEGGFFVVVVLFRSPANWIVPNHIEGRSSTLSALTHRLINSGNTFSQE